MALGLHLLGSQAPREQSGYASTAQPSTARCASRLRVDGAVADVAGPPRDILWPSYLSRA